MLSLDLQTTTQPWIQRILVVLLAVILATPLRADFVRGDVNRDGRVNVADAVAGASALFSIDTAVPCQDAADANDDGALDLSDTLTTLRFLFADDSLPYPQPPDVGPDATCDLLDCADATRTSPAVVINEIHYHPNEILNENLEFVELHNRSAIDVDLAGYGFNNGIQFTFPKGAMLLAGGYALILKDPESRLFRSRPGEKYGPFEGSLADGGERLTLHHNECVIETVRYDDRNPWPLAPDGYKPTLERSSPWTSAEDPHSWRATLARSGQLAGTPGEENTTRGTPTHPFITMFQTTPEHPTSSDAVEVRMTLDLGPEEIQSVTLRWERADTTVTEPQSTTMQLEASGTETTTYLATIPPEPSQTMVRCNIAVELTAEPAAAGPLILPHPGDEVPVHSYFVYDGEVSSLLPVLWAFPERFSGIVPRDGVKLSGVAIQDVGEPFAREFDGAEVRRRSTNNTPNNGLNLTYLKGKEFAGQKTLNFPPESGGQTGAGGQVEQTANLIFRELGALAPEAFWFRVVDYSEEGEARHTQRIGLQQVNRRFLELNDVNPDGDLYKFDRFGFIKRTDLESGDQSRLDLIAALLDGRVRDVYDLESVAFYSAISILVGNWDGFGGNNLFIYFDEFDSGRWKFIPWDLDNVFRCDMGLTFPLDGEDGGSCPSRRPALTDFFHKEPDLDAIYRSALRSFVAPEGPFSPEALEPELAAFETLLLNDLALQEAALGITRDGRRNAIVGAYQTMRDFIRERAPVVRAALEEG